MEYELFVSHQLLPQDAKGIDVYSEYGIRKERHSFNSSDKINRYTYYIEFHPSEFSLFPTTYRYVANLGKNTYQLVKELKKLQDSGPYTNDSMKKALSKYPRLGELVTSNFRDMFNDFNLESNGYIIKDFINYPSKLTDKVRGQYLETFLFFLWELIDEIKNGINIETQYLEINQNLVKIRNFVRDVSNDTPKWAKRAIAVGGIILIKAAVNSIGQNIDIDVPFDFDGNDNTDMLGNIGDDNSDIIGAIGNDSVNGMDFDYANDYNQSSSGSYNISFGSQTPPNHSTDGYIFQGGQKFNGFQVYTKQGHTYYWDHIKDIWVKIK